MNIKISVIIPCYNGYKYIQKCLKSLEMQEYREFEVIVIDDCSSDDTYQKLKEIENDFSFQFSVYQNEENHGPGYSRQKGVEKAQGDYICFCDADDWYEDTFLKKMVDKLEAEKSDLVMCDCYYVHKQFRKAAAWSSVIDDCSSKKEIMAFAYESMCLILVKKNILETIQMPKLYHSEDAAVIPVLVSKCNKITILKSPLYNYLMREDSASNVFDRDAFDSSIEVFEYITKNVESGYEDEVEFLGIKGILYIGCMNALKAGVSNSDIKKAVKAFLLKYPKYRENKYYNRYSKVKKIFISSVVHNCFVISKLLAYLHTRYINR